MKPPIHLNHLKYCDRGLISEDKKPEEFDKYSKKIGEFIDVYCVANKNKNLAALDFSSYGIRKFRKMDKDLINSVIDYCNSKNVQILHNKKTGGMYLKSVFFLPKNYKNALKLMKIVWYPELMENITIITYHCYVGLLLGYSKKNIKFFIKKNYERNITNTDLSKIMTEINNMEVTFEDLQSRYKIVHLTTIKNI